MAFTRDYEVTHPAGTEAASLGDDRVRYLKVDLGERLNDMLYGFDTENTDAPNNVCGVKILRFYPQSSPTGVADYIFFFGKDDAVTSKVELHYKDEDSNERQLTDAGELVLGKHGAPRPYLHNTTHEDADGGRESRIIAKGEQSGGEITTLGYIEFSHDGESDDQKGQWKLVVNDGDDDNTPSKVAIVGKSTGKIDASESLAILDEDDMASDDADCLATQQSIKKFVEDQCDAHVPTSVSGENDSVGEATIGELCIKWGDTTLTTLQEKTITFTTEGLTAFPNNCFQVFCCFGNDSTGYASAVYSVTKTNFVLKNGDNETRTIRWFAIGC